jgi:hypothetical protein
MNVDDAFSGSYAQARERFLAAAADAGLSAEACVHPRKGRDGETLAMDVARDGHPSAASLLIVSSACHGVEGFCGSGVQVAMLRDPQWLAHARARGVAVLFIHALNPWGFSHIQRTTHENVDLNRNFQDFERPLPQNPAYRELHPLLLPEAWPPSADNQRATAQYVAERGMPALQAAISGGQYEFPDGMFFGGTSPTWSNKALRDALRVHGRRASRIGWIDLHTGLGPNGVGERIYSGAPDDAAHLARARAWWDGGGRSRVTSIYDGSSSSAVLTGLMWTALPQECPQAEYTGIALEYGTVPMMDTITAMRGAHWLRLHPEAPAALAEQIRAQMLAAFYTDTPQWKQQVLDQARDALTQAVDGLAVR